MVHASKVKFYGYIPSVWASTYLIPCSAIKLITCLFKIYCVKLHCLRDVPGEGVPKTRAEIIPIEPDAGNADEGRQACYQDKKSFSRLG
jgi:hypothetical protein